MQHASDIQSVASPPEAPAEEPSNTEQLPERSSRFKRWIWMWMKKIKPDRLPGKLQHSGLPDPHQPPMRANKGPSIVAEGQREKVTVLARRLNVPSLTPDSSERSRNLLQGQGFVILRVFSQSLIALCSPNHHQRLLFLPLKTTLPPSPRIPLLVGKAVQTQRKRARCVFFSDGKPCHYS